MNVTERQEQEFENWMNELEEAETAANQGEATAEEESQEPEEADTEEQPEADSEEAAPEEPAEGTSVREFVLETDEDLVAIGEKKLKAAELKRIVQDYENDTKWKQKNQERGQRLNKAEQILQRIEQDPEFAEWMGAYQDPHERELLQHYDENTARMIRQLQIENQSLKATTASQQAEQQYLQEEQELLQSGTHPDDLAKAYEVLVEKNQEHYRATGQPMSLRFAYASYLANGGQQVLMERLLKQQQNKTQERNRVEKKQNLPSDLGRSGSVPPPKTDPEDPLESDIWTEEMFKDIPVN